MAASFMLFSVFWWLYGQQDRQIEHRALQSALVRAAVEAEVKHIENKMYPRQLPYVFTEPVIVHANVDDLGKKAEYTISNEGKSELVASLGGERPEVRDGNRTIAIVTSARVLDVKEMEMTIELAHEYLHSLGYGREIVLRINGTRAVEKSDLIAIAWDPNDRKAIEVRPVRSVAERFN